MPVAADPEEPVEDELRAASRCFKNDGTDGDVQKPICFRDFVIVRNSQAAAVLTGKRAVAVVSRIAMHASADRVGSRLGRARTKGSAGRLQCR
jgi:hypothetical protein